MLMLLIYQASRPRVGEVWQMPGDPDAFLNVRRRADAREVPGVLVLRIYGPVVYTNAAMVTGRVKELVGGAAATPSAVVLDISATDRLDVTSAEALDDLARALQSAGIALALARGAHARGRDGAADARHGHERCRQPGDGCAVRR